MSWQVVDLNSVTLLFAVRTNLLVVVILDIFTILIGSETMFVVTNTFNVTIMLTMRASLRNLISITCRFTFFVLVINALLANCLFYWETNKKILVIGGMISMRRTLNLMLLYWSLSPRKN